MGWESIIPFNKPSHQIQGKVENFGHLNKLNLATHMDTKSFIQ